MARRWVAIMGGWTALLCGVAAASAAECPGNPGALGTSRIIAVDPAEHPRLGSMQYGESLPLADREVVLTFDDGPLPPYTNRVLDALATECVKATFFIVGRMARAYPDRLRQIHAAGHTIGTHSQNHPLILDRMTLARAQSEIEEGIASTAAALGNPQAVAPFFRVPGLARTAPMEAYLQGRGLMTWSADLVADDWRRIQASEVLRRALHRLEARGRGILLLHDIQPVTALALPVLLKELKARGYRVVHVVPAGADQPKTATEPQEWAWAQTKRPDLRLVRAGAQPPANGPATAGSEQTPERPSLEFRQAIGLSPLQPAEAVQPWPSPRAARLAPSRAKARF